MPNVPRTKIWIKKDIMKKAFHCLDILNTIYHESYLNQLAKVIVKQQKKGKDTIPLVAEYILKEWMKK